MALNTEIYVFKYQFILRTIEFCKLYSYTPYTLICIFFNFEHFEIHYQNFDCNYFSYKKMVFFKLA